MVNAVVYLFFALAIAGLIYAWGKMENKSLSYTGIDITLKKIPKEFDGFTIAQISDLHNDVFGEGQSRLVEAVGHLNPDAIFITGDLIDSRRTNIDDAMAFVRAAVKIAPIYYVPGNHESRIGKYYVLRDSMSNIGVNILENRSVTIKRGKSEIRIAGVLDTSFRLREKEGLDPAAVMRENIEKSIPRDGLFTILLSHRPELFDVYSQCVDLVFCGHAHGGQIRLPIIGGLYAPQQGVFPKYTSGAYEKNGSFMIVSRGLGNSLFPLRLGNKPDVVRVILKTEK